MRKALEALYLEFGAGILTLATDTATGDEPPIRSFSEPIQTLLVAMAATDTRRRVKVYSFNEKMQWEDMGTGHVSVDFVERLQSLIIKVRSEDDGKLLGFLARFSPAFILYGFQG